MVTTQLVQDFTQRTPKKKKKNTQNRGNSNSVLSDVLLERKPSLPLLPEPVAFAWMRGDVGIP